MTEHETQAAAVVLAAGHGVRMRSDLPKVAHVANGRPLLGHVLAALDPVPALTRKVIVTSGRPEIERAVAREVSAGGISFATQQPARGTADAVRVGLDELALDDGTVLVTYGDTPLMRTETFEAMLRAHGANRAAATVLVARVSDPTGYGRVVRAPDGTIERVVEERDATDSERAIDEINAGTYVFSARALRAALGRIDSGNAQGELYLTDVVGELRSAGAVVAAVEAAEADVAGVNSRAELAEAAAELRRRACARWMSEGVTIVDPATTYIESSVTIGRDATIHPFTFLEGDTALGERAEIGPHARVVDSEIGPEAVVTFAVVVGTRLEAGTGVGPFASLRGGTVLEQGARAGTFVELKKTRVGPNSKVPHLSYMGDATIGRAVNVGAGSITCNYDGERKHETHLEDDVFIGSDTMMVAPVRVGRGAATGAGAVVRDDVPAGALAVGVPARVLEGRARPRRGPEGPEATA
ncbi:MAG TPA: bifunctional UDP-N-acetylglucosamine diphosphorylase/glucosamine-1-phosphate N-acetyltransferase GlmU [Actinomycetota bacterium]|nr:bifunctional UDP-N-acetylglucosamine diphosphorylase/glucosamine-1-phosphate N-acetyltransferase GlmU [Actinomycetota bacterium]